MDSENASKLDALGTTSLVLTVLTVLTLVTFIVLVLGNYTDRNRPPDWVDDTTSIFLIFSPLLSILSIIVGIFARKRGSVKQKKVANRCISLGILGMITSGGLFMLLINWMLSIIA